MSREEAIAIIRNEYLCVDRDCDIEDSCGECEFNMPSSKELILTAYSMAIKALEQEPCDDATLKDIFCMGCEYREQEPCEDTVSRGVFEQVRWERDIAIEQLRELGYELGQKIESCSDAISREMALKECHDIVVDGERYRVIQEETLLGLPPVTQKSGEWIMPVQDDGMSDPIYYQVRCSKCGFDLDPQTWHMELHQYGADKYCPKCGAKMVESQEGEVRNERSNT